MLVYHHNIIVQYVLEYHLGGMIYSELKEKGVKKKGIPPPCEIELPLTASYIDVLQVGKDNFFNDDEITLDRGVGSKKKVRGRTDIKVF